MTTTKDLYDGPFPHPKAMVLADVKEGVVFRRYSRAIGWSPEDEVFSGPIVVKNDTDNWLNGALWVDTTILTGEWAGNTYRSSLADLGLVPYPPHKRDEVPKFNEYHYCVKVEDLPRRRDPDPLRELELRLQEYEVPFMPDLVPLSQGQRYGISRALSILREVRKEYSEDS